MDTDTHGCGLPASSRSTGRRLEQNCMVMFWRNAGGRSIAVARPIGNMLPIGFDLVRPRGCQHERVQVAVGDGNISRPGIVAGVQADGAWLPPGVPAERASGTPHKLLPCGPSRPTRTLLTRRQRANLSFDSTCQDRIIIRNNVNTSRAITCLK